MKKNPPSRAVTYLFLADRTKMSAVGEIWKEVQKRERKGISDRIEKWE